MLRRDCVLSCRRCGSTAARTAPFILGFAGGIGSGKSLRSKHLANVNKHTALTRELQQHFEQAPDHVPPRHRIDCDLLAHRMYTPCPENENFLATYNAVVRHFGRGITNPHDGTIDRRKLGAIVFADRAQLAALNSLVWPAIAAAAREEISSLPRASVVLLEAAVLIAMPDLLALCDALWLYTVSREEALRRVVERDATAESSAASRIDAQGSLEQQLRLWEASLRGKKECRLPVTVFDTTTDTVRSGCIAAEQAFCDQILKALD